jgi:hypothetical protein
MASQPIVDSITRSVYAYEALVRGTNGKGAGEVIARLRPEQTLIDGHFASRSMSESGECGSGLRSNMAARRCRRRSQWRDRRPARS